MTWEVIRLVISLFVIFIIGVNIGVDLAMRSKYKEMIKTLNEVRKEGIK